MLVNNNGQLFRHPLMSSDLLDYTTNLLVFDFFQYEFICDQTVAENLRTAAIKGNRGEQEAVSYLTVEHKVG